jgi:hypothetical protein
MSQITQLAAGQITAVDTLTIELVETAEHPTVVIIRWPIKPTVIHPHRFGTAADGAPVRSRLLLSGWLKSDGTGSCEPQGLIVEPRPVGPHELYWRCRVQGADAYRQAS